MKIKIKKRDQKAIESAHTVASIDDLLVEILLLLPIKSLIRFKSVSKHWLSIISNPQFALRRNPNPNPALGLFLRERFFSLTYKFHYIPLNLNAHNPAISSTPSFDKIMFTMDTLGADIIQSCNGLLLCVDYRTSRHIPTYYIYNPTTKDLTTLPKLNRGRGTGNGKFVIGIALAFDPAKSPHYKVVCLRKSEKELSKYQIEIYSSEEGPWRSSGGPFTIADVSSQFGFQYVVYWNGAVFWITMRSNNTLYFNVDDERLGQMPVPPPPPADDWDRGRRRRPRIAYFGESCNHLHLIAIYGSKIQFNVYEMKRDCSEWFVKYKVDLAEVANAFPEMVRKFRREDEICEHVLSIFSLIRDENEDGDAILALQIPVGQAISYNVVNGNFEKLCDFEDSDGEFNPYLPIYQYIQSLCSVGYCFFLLYFLLSIIYIYNY